MATNVEYRSDKLDKFVDFINKHSYTMYLIHVLIINIFKTLLPDFKGYLWGVIILTLTIIVSILVDEMILVAGNRSMRRMKKVEHSMGKRH